MDERELEAAFRAAADGGPAPAFGHADVVRASERITARRRSQVRGAVAALVVVAGLGGVGGAVALSRASGTATSASAEGVPAAGDAAGGAAPNRAAAQNAGAAPQDAGPGGSPAAGGDVGPLAGAPLPPSRPGVPLGPGTGPCADRQDPALRALLNTALPGAAGAPEAATSDVCLPGAQRYVSIELGGAVLTVAYLPPGTEVALASGSISARTASGGTVIVPKAYPQLLDRLAPEL
jgi:hypothetical protein